MTASIRHVLLDIEGTTCPVSFVTAVLFPHAAAALEGYLASHHQQPEIAALLSDLEQAWQQETDPEAQGLRPGILGSQERSGRPEGWMELLSYLRWLIRTDRKQTAWKDLQGHIWREGYARGEIRAQLFDEVPETLRSWKRQGLALSVYSSGSVPAQQLLYGHSQEGDLRPLFSHWFDTRIGRKQDSDSYRAILRALSLDPQALLFISDATSELQAASAAGIQVCFSLRDGNPERDPQGFPCITALDQANALLGLDAAGPHSVTWSGQA